MRKNLLTASVVASILCMLLLSTSKSINAAEDATSQVTAAEESEDATSQAKAAQESVPDTGSTSRPELVQDLADLLRSYSQSNEAPRTSRLKDPNKIQLIIKGRARNSSWIRRLSLWIYVDTKILPANLLARSYNILSRAAVSDSERFIALDIPRREKKEEGGDFHLIYRPFVNTGMYNLEEAMVTDSDIFDALALLAADSGR